MTIDRVREFYDMTPFRPFTIHLADGRSIRVHHREFIMATPSGRTVIVCQPDDTLNVVDVELVTDIEIRIAKNGRRPRS